MDFVMDATHRKLLVSQALPLRHHFFPFYCCEKLLGLAGGNTKKHGNKKSGESRTPIRYNVIHMYIFIFAKLS